eukprot:TRINITY_DN4032_c0_g1_i2.p1 TRINITY_DN4032_c0_g1~~TRINITY_DN4032_c0_g1_i2.p1  ORF type:complete len:351 (+),score=122.93 TRINITY_DN4032_c0_g1_i2:177-1229(+)
MCIRDRKNTYLLIQIKNMSEKIPKKPKSDKKVSMSSEVQPKEKVLKENNRQINKKNKQTINPKQDNKKEMEEEKEEEKKEIVQKQTKKTQKDKKKNKINQKQMAKNNEIEEEQEKEQQQEIPNQQEDSQKVEQKEEKQEKEGEQNGPENPSKKQKKVRQRSSKTSKRLNLDKPKTKAEEMKKIIYIGHLPYGLEEEELKKYFGQYGNITNIMVVRSKKTARIKGYGFIQFEYPEIATIAAQSMNGHMILQKVLQCHVLDENQHNPFDSKLNKEFKFINWKKIYQAKINKEKDSTELAKQVSKLIEKEKEKKKKLQECGIDYDFPGYASILNVEPKLTKKQKKSEEQNQSE